MKVVMITGQIVKINHSAKITFRLLISLTIINKEIKTKKVLSKYIKLLMKKSIQILILEHSNFYTFNKIKKMHRDHYLKGDFIILLIKFKNKLKKNKTRQEVSTVMIWIFIKIYTPLIIKWIKLNNILLKNIKMNIQLVKYLKAQTVNLNLLEMFHLMAEIIMIFLLSLKVEIIKII